MTETKTGVTVGHVAVFKDVNGNIGDGGALPTTSATTLTGEATGTGTGTVPTTLTNSAVIGKVLTGYVSASGVVAPTDTILQAIQKINGNTAALVGAVIYQGTWNANTNTPTLASGTGTKGQLYKVSVAGSTLIDGITQWNVGDAIVFNGAVWDKIDGLANEVISVAGRTGAVVLTAADLTNGMTGSGAVVLGTSPTLVTPTLGNASATSINKVAFTAPATGATFTIADGKTFKVDNTMEFQGADSTLFIFPGSSDYVVVRDGTQTLINKTIAYTSNTLTGVVPTTTTVNGNALSSNVVVSASQITTGTLPAAQLPLATSSTFGAVEPDNSTITIAAGVISAAAAAGVLKNVQIFTANGTYTPTSGVTKALMFGIGGGGGGGGAGGSTGAGGNGGNGTATTVGAILNAPPGMQGVGGGSGAAGAGGDGGNGGGQAGNTGGIGTLKLIGNSGDAGNVGTASNFMGGKGGAGIFGTGTGGNGGAAAAVGVNTGAGGAGGLNDSALGGMGGGGGSGQTSILYTTSISGTYAVTIGAAGSAGAAGTGTGSRVGKAGATGVVIILEFA